jgi:transketolase C-terminal domain/subunit
MNRHAADILPVAAGQMVLNALNAAAKLSHGQPLVDIFIVSNAEARYL